MKKTLAFLKSHKAFTVYLIFVLLIVLVAVFAKQIAPYEPTASKLRDAFQPPSPEHRFGTDFLGRDLFSRVIFRWASIMIPMVSAGSVPFSAVV